MPVGRFTVFCKKCFVCRFGELLERLYVKKESKLGRASVFKKNTDRLLCTKAREKPYAETKNRRLTGLIPKDGGLVFLMR